MAIRGGGQLVVEEVDHRGAFGGATDNPPIPRWMLPKTISISQSVRTETINLFVVEFHHQLHEKKLERTKPTKPNLKKATLAVRFKKNISDFWVGF